MKPAIPKYLEHTAFGAQAKREHPGAFAGGAGAGAAIAQQLPQRLVLRGAARARGTAKSSGLVAEAGDEPASYIANAPFASGASAVYFEAEIAAGAAGDVAVDIGVEKRRIGGGGAAAAAPTPSSEDDSSDLDEDDELSPVQTALSAAWLGGDGGGDDAGDADEGRLVPHGAGALASTLEQAPVWDWVWKLGSGMLRSVGGGRSSLSHFDLQLAEPVKGPLAAPVRVGLCLDLVANKVVLTRDGRVVAVHVVDGGRVKERPNALGDGVVLVPTLAVRNARVRPVFGDGNLPNDGFCFDIASYCRSQFSLPALPKLVAAENGAERLMQLMLEYFAFYGYTDTVDAWMRQRGGAGGGAGAGAGASLALRGQIREHIRRGDIARVYELLALAGVCELSTELRFKLEFQAFVELVRTSSDMDRVLAQGRLLFTRYNADADADVRAKLELASGLLVSTDPADPVHEALCGPEAVYELTTAVLSAVSEAEGGTPAPQLNCVLEETCALLSRFARHGNGTASLVAGELARQAGWH